MKKINIGIFFVMFLFLILGSVSGYTITNFNGLTGKPSYTPQYIYTGLDYGVCQDGNDFIFQIDPLSCEPKLITSDLLEDRPVTVYCRIIGTKVNPFIEVDAISNIRITGDRNSYIQSVGYLHSEAALVDPWQQTIINDKFFMKDFGYAAITVKKIPSEKDMPDTVNGTLTAELDYDIQNAFGVGNAQYYLPLLTEREFENNKERYSFWNGKGYARLVGIYDNAATVELYGPSLQKIGGAIELKQGQESQEIMIPGLNPCLATLRIRMNEIVDVNTKARLKINSDYIELTKGEKFLDGKCELKDLNNQGITQEVKIVCKNDQGRNEEIYLKINPKVSLRIGGEDQRDYEVGDYLYDSDDKNIYLAYIGTKGDYKDRESLFAVLISIPKDRLSHEEIVNKRLSNDNLRAISTQMNLILSRTNKNADSWTKFIDIIKQSLGNLIRVGRWLIDGENLEIFEIEKVGDQQDSAIKIFKEKYVSFKGFATPVDNELIVVLEKNYTLGNIGSDNYGNITEYDQEDPIKNIKYTKSEEEVNKNHPKIFIKKELDGEEEIILAVFYGNECKENKHSECKGYTLKEINQSASDGTIFKDVVYGNISRVEEIYKMILKSRFYDGEDEHVGFYKKSMIDFETLFNTYHSEPIEGSEKTYGEEGLREAIELANKLGQKETMKKLCDDFRSNYPNSPSYPEKSCHNEYHMASSELNSKQIFINYKLREISLEEIYEPPFEDYGAEVYIRNNKDGQVKSIKLSKGSRYYLGEEDEGNSEYIELTEVIDEKSAIFKSNLIDTSSDKKEVYRYIERNVLRVEESINLRSNYEFTLVKTNLKKDAKITIIPRINYAKSKVKFNYSIGIEKRKILLTDDMISKHITDLDKVVETLEKTIDFFDTSNKIIGGLCLGTGGILIAKNLINNLNHGEILARNIVMTGEGGWNQICKEMLSDTSNEYYSLEDCFFKNADEIDAQVKKIAEKMKENNKIIETIKKSNTSLSDEEIVKKFVSIFNKTLETLNVSNITNPNAKEGEPAISVRKILTSLENEEDLDKFSLEEFTNSQLYLFLYQEKLGEIINKKGKATKTDQNELNLYQKKLFSSLSDIEKKSDLLELAKELNKKAGEGNYAIENLKDRSIKVMPVLEYKKFKESFYSKNNFTVSGSKYTILDEDYYFVIQEALSASDQYLFIYNKEGIVKKTYKINKKKKELIPEEEEGDKTNPFGLRFTKSEKYNNKYLAPEVSYYEDGPYKGYPAVVPLSEEEGWYVGIKDSGTISAYDDSGRVNIIWLCNVGRKGINEFDVFSDNFGENNCQQYILDREIVAFSGLSLEKTRELIDESKKAIKVVQDAHKRGATQVSIGNAIYNIGMPVSEALNIQCETYMSPKDCRILFNVCDPVVCPSSRCDFGGSYPVSDVVQTGIIGSILLCLPNAKEGIIVPVCTTGIQAGLESWASILNSYRDCLDDYVEKGELHGMCDRVHGIYLCELFWEKMIPLGERYISKKIGENKKSGGGEYLFLPAALSNAQDSLSYFTQYYAKEAYRAFQLKATSEVGTSFCKVSASVVFPDGKNIIDSAWNFIEGAVTPRSPVQFTGSFEEKVLTTRTNPPTSHYKVSYFIYAGKDQGVAYQVYLKGESSSYYQDFSPTYFVDSGYLPAGQSVDDSKNFAAPSNYKTLCIMVNGEETCGFNQKASTSFVTNSLNDLYLSEQSKKTDITTEQECVSGSISIFSVLNPTSLQGIPNALINPDIYKSGITRVCATDSPGKGTDSKWNDPNESRWRDVGYCDNEKLRCWIDVQSVEKAIINSKIESETLEEISESHLTYINEIMENEGYFENAAYQQKFEKIEGEEDYKKKIELIDAIIGSVFWDAQKAPLYLLRGKAYSNLALEKLVQKNNFGRLSGIKTEEQIKAMEEREKLIKAENMNEIRKLIEGFDKYPIMLYKKGNLFRVDFYYRYYKYENSEKGIWQFSKNKKDWYDVSGTDLPYPEKEAFNKKIGDGEAVRLINEKYEGYIDTASSIYGIDKNLIKAIILKESDGKNNTVSNNDCYGLMQISKYAINDVYEKDLLKNRGAYSSIINLYDEYELKNKIFDPEINIMVGTSYFEILNRVYFEKIKDKDELTKLSLLAYYRGIGEVEKSCAKGKNIKWEYCNDEISKYKQYVSDILFYQKMFEKGVIDYDQLVLGYHLSSAKVNVNNRERGIIVELDGKDYSEGIEFFVDEINRMGAGSLVSSEIEMNKNFEFEFLLNTLNKEKILIFNTPKNVYSHGYKVIITKEKDGLLWHLKNYNSLFFAKESNVPIYIPISGRGSFMIHEEGYEKRFESQKTFDYEANLANSFCDILDNLKDKEIHEIATVLFALSRKDEFVLSKTGGDLSSQDSSEDDSLRDQEGIYKIYEDERDQAYEDSWIQTENNDPPENLKSIITYVESSKRPLNMDITHFDEWNKIKKQHTFQYYEFEYFKKDESAKIVVEIAKGKFFAIKVYNKDFEFYNSQNWFMYDSDFDGELDVLIISEGKINSLDEGKLMNNVLDVIDKPDEDKNWRGIELEEELEIARTNNKYLSPTPSSTHKIYLPVSYDDNVAYYLNFEEGDNYWDYKIDPSIQRAKNLFTYLLGEISEKIILEGEIIQEGNIDFSEEDEKIIANTYNEIDSLVY